MYTTCIIWLAFIPIYFGTGNSFEVRETEQITQDSRCHFLFVFACLVCSTKSVRTTILTKKAATRHLPSFSVWIWDSIRYLVVKDAILIWKEKRYCPLWCLIQDALFSSGSNNDAVHFHLSQRVRHACLSILTKNIHHRLPGKKPFSNFLLANVNFFPQHESFANVKI